MHSKFIGIATLHYGFNEGAILQSYALARLIETRMKYRTAIIDQRYLGKVAAYGKPSNARQEALQDAIDSWLPCADQSFRTNDASLAFEYANRECAALIVGSDVVWGLRYRRRLRRLLGRGILPSQSDSFFPAFPNFYWPGRAVRIPKLSYAASVGTFEWTDTPKNHRRKMRDILASFSVLSVRDERTLLFLEWLDPHLADRALTVPDPTIAMDIRCRNRISTLKNQLISWGVNFSRPRFGVIFDDHPIVAETARRFRSQGYQIVGITTKNDFSDVVLYDKPIHPLDWSILFHFMDICIVNRMHAAIFCLHNRTPFVVVDSYAPACFSESKTVSLMRRFGMEEFCLPKTVEQAELESVVLKLMASGMPSESISDGLAKANQEVEAFFGQAVSAIEQQTC